MPPASSVALPHAANTYVVLDSTNGPLVLDTEGVVLRRGQDEVPMTRTEFLMLRALAETPGKVVSRARLLSAASPDGHVGDIRNLAPHISRLRTKIEVDANTPRLIKTIRGFGYRLDLQ